MSEMPETLRNLGYHLRVMADKASEQIDADRLSRAADEVERADLPPTLSAAMELPEVRALVERLDNPWAADDGIEKGAAPLWCGQYMQEAKHALTAALDEIERLRKKNATLHTSNGGEPAPTVAVREWQPIETAPKDALIDIWLAEGKRWCACYHDIITDEWRTSRPSGHLISIKARFVTHWMPLPEPPQSKFTPLEAIAGGDDE